MTRIGFAAGFAASLVFSSSLGLTAEPVHPGTSYLKDRFEKRDWSGVMNFATSWMDQDTLRAFFPLTRDPQFDFELKLWVADFVYYSEYLRDRPNRAALEIRDEIATAFSHDDKARLLAQWKSWDRTISGHVHFDLLLEFPEYRSPDFDQVAVEEVIPERLRNHRPWWRDQHMRPLMLQFLVRQNQNLDRDREGQKLYWQVLGRDLSAWLKEDLSGGQQFYSDYLKLDGLSFKKQIRKTQVNFKYSLWKYGHLDRARSGSLAEKIGRCLRWFS